MDNREELLWVEKEIVPKIAEAMGKGGEKLKCEITVPTESYFVSAIYMVELIFGSEYETGEDRMRLVVKMPTEDETTSAFLRTDLFFHNEIIFYQRFAKNYSDYPRCVLIISDTTARPVIVLENVSQFGFKHMPSSEDIDIRRVLAAVREIGRFHARGYVLKEKNPEEFYGVANELRELHDDTDHPVMIEYVNTMSVRPIDYLCSVDCDPSFSKAMLTFLSNAHENVLQDCVKHRDELAVLGHGDFTLNNVLFKEEVGGELKTMLIDFACFRYASPAVDVSTFLYMSCTGDLRKNFPVIFRAYHDAVIEYLAEQGVQDVEKYSFDAFLKDYKRHAIFGCVIALFFMPVMHRSFGVEFEEFVREKTKHFEILRKSGGDALTKRLADMLLELKDHGCLDHVM